MSNRVRITIIGSGFSGTLTAVRLLQFAETPTEVCLLEKDEGMRYGGIAYGTMPTTWDHMLNIQAGRITLYREYPADFLEWINNEADRMRWPAKWRFHKFGLSCVVPRRIYSQYLKERLHSTAAAAHTNVVLTELKGEAIDLVPGDDGYNVQYVAYENGRAETKSMWSDYVVLATGHLEPMEKPFFNMIRNSDRFIADPYSRRAKETYGAIDRDEKVLIVGSALSAFDSVISLLHNGHDGEIVISSRNGYMHQTYPVDHQHDILMVHRPAFLDVPRLDAKAVEEGVKAEYMHLRNMFSNEHGIAETVIAERIMKAWEPYLVELAQKLETKDLQMLLDRYKSLIVTNRTSTVAEIGEVVRSRMQSYPGAPKKITVLPAQISDMHLLEDETRICVTFSDSDEPMLFDRVINCLGNNSDFSQTRHSLWKHLIGTHMLAQPHLKTRRGIEVGQHGQVIAKDGQVQQRLFSVGPMRQGDETVRRGRLGAFVFSIGTLRNQCFDTSMEILRRVEYGADRAFTDIPESIMHCPIATSEFVARGGEGELPESESGGLLELLARFAEGSLLGQIRNILMTHCHNARAIHKSALDRTLQEMRLRIINDFHLDYACADRVVRMMASLIEAHVVHTMCDIKHLAKWESAEYGDQVMNSDTMKEKTMVCDTCEEPACYMATA